MRTRIVSLGIGIAAFCVAGQAWAAPSSITYTYDHHIISVAVNAHPEWRQSERKWFFHGMLAVPPSRLRSCGDEEALELGWTYRDTVGWNEEMIKRTLEDSVASVIDRPAGSVQIGRTGSGTVTFEGVGLTGRITDTRTAAALTVRALHAEIDTVRLPVAETQPEVVILDEGLRAMGIKEVVTIGESVFAKSPVNRRHNINVGLQKFNGHIIPKDGVFSFVEILGPVNASTGYRKELVINGETTLPDYGGGLCQVSTTAYRGPWEYGLPIVQRKNHSYAVSYYSPQGTDATIYPPNVDMKFRNDTQGALLIQTYSDEKDRAFFIYYGTKDDRMSEVFGPYITNRIAASRTERVSYTTDIPVGERRKAGERHDGLSATWYRTVRIGTGTTTERFFSLYEARPLYWQVGVTPEEMARLTAGDTNLTPSWLPSKE